MAGMFESWGNALKDLADKLFGGPKKDNWHGLNPGDVGYIQAVFEIPIKENPGGKRSAPIASTCKRWDERQRKHKIDRKGHRMKKRVRQEGPYATG